MDILLAHKKPVLLLIIGTLLFCFPCWAAGGEDSPKLTQAERIYSSILDASLAGRLPKSRAVDAEKIWLAYKKKLIALSARIEIYRLDASEQTGTLREQALDNLVMAGGERERLVANTLQQLTTLANNDKSADQAYPQKAGVEGNQTTGPSDALETGEDFRRKILSVTSESEDLSTGEFE